jgi:hypothetical protein
MKRIVNHGKITKEVIICYYKFNFFPQKIVHTAWKREKLGPTQL